MKPSERLLQRALLSVRVDGYSIRKAARTHSVPYVTLHDRLKSGRSLSTGRTPRGRKPCFSTAEETMLSQAILKAADQGFPMSRDDIADAI